VAQGNLIQAAGLVGLVGVFLATAAVLPLQVPPLVDEPILASSAFEWARSGAIDISGLSAPVAWFDTIWGGIFARWLGPTYAALRWSTIVLTAISAPFLYWQLCYVTSAKSFRLIGTAVYLFNPLTLVLSVTFMSDMHTVSLGVIAGALLLTGLTRERHSINWLTAGSLVASLGFFSRPQALVVPLAAAAAVWTGSGSTKLKVCRFVGVSAPIALVVSIYLWWSSSHEQPFIRELSQEALRDRFATDIGPFLAIAAIFAIVYIGLVALPLVPTFARFEGGSIKSVVGASALGVLTMGVAAVALGKSAEAQGWVTWTGLASVDKTQLGHRPELGPEALHIVILLAAVVTATAFTYAVGRLWPPSQRRIRTFLVLMIGGTIASAILASMTFHSTIHDRYILPALPAIVVLAVGVAVLTPWRVSLSAGAIGLLAAFGAVGTYDGLIAQQEIVRFADDAIESGIDPLQFDGGASWSAITFGVADDEGPGFIFSRSGPFWIKFYAVDTEPVFGVALEPLQGYKVLDRREIPSMLHRAPLYDYLVEREERPYFRVEDY
jgi:hypothetical protein